MAPAGLRRKGGLRCVSQHLGCDLQVKKFGFIHYSELTGTGRLGEATPAEQARRRLHIAVC